MLSASVYVYYERAYTRFCERIRVAWCERIVYTCVVSDVARGGVPWPPTRLGYLCGHHLRGKYC